MNLRPEDFVRPYVFYYTIWEVLFAKSAQIIYDPYVEQDRHGLYKIWMSSNTVVNPKHLDQGNCSNNIKKGESTYLVWRAGMCSTASHSIALSDTHPPSHCNSHSYEICYWCTTCVCINVPRSVAGRASFAVPAAWSCCRRRISRCAGQWAITIKTGVVIVEG